MYYLPLVLFCLFLWATPVYAQLPANTVNLSPTCTVAGLQTGCPGGPEPGRTAWVVDAVDAVDCTVGGASSTAAVPHECIKRTDGVWISTASGLGTLSRCNDAVYAIINPTLGVDGEFIAVWDFNSTVEDEWYNPYDGETMVKAGKKAIPTAKSEIFGEIVDLNSTWAQTDGSFAFTFSGAAPIEAALEIFLEGRSAISNAATPLMYIEFNAAFHNEGALAIGDEITPAAGAIHFWQTSSSAGGTPDKQQAYTVGFIAQIDSIDANDTIGFIMNYIKPADLGTSTLDLDSHNLWIKIWQTSPACFR